MRDIKNICSGDFDVLVIGGGAHGATVAFHAARAGYATGLVEKGDFGGATSANSLKIIHGGLRYLQHGNIKRMRHSILARKEMMQLAPHLVLPLACIMPIHGNGLRGKRAMQAALFLNNCISWDRNKGLPENVRLPRGHIISAQKCLAIVPGIENSGLTGAAVWYDAIAIDTERLIMEYVLQSIHNGARAVNYVQALDIAKDDAGLYRVKLCDQLTREVFYAKAKWIINAAGPWFEQTLKNVMPARKMQKWAVAINLISKKKLFDDYAVALEGVSEYKDKDALIKRGKRLYFFVPWRGYTMIGTEYEVCDHQPDGLAVKKELIQKMVDGINSIYPDAGLSYQDISFYHAGLMPIQDESANDNIQLEKNSSFQDHAQEGFENVISIRGVKFTTAPYVAGQVVKYLSDKKCIGHEGRKSKEYQTTRASLATEANSLYPHLSERYGPRAMSVLSFMNKSDDQEVWIDESSGLLKAEVEYLITEEMAYRLSDIVLRRTGIGTAECPRTDFLRKVAEYMGSILGWDEIRCKQEVNEVTARYNPLQFSGNKS